MTSKSVLDLHSSGATRSAASGRGGEVPRPRFRLMTRVVLPGGILAGIAALLLGSAWNSMMPAVAVQAETVVEKAVSGARPGTSVVQAAGWVEADPYLQYASALTDGVVEEVLVLEGNPVEAGQVVARLVPDDAKLALERAEAKARQMEAAVLEARARLDAARTDWDNPVERDRAVATSEAARQEILARIARTKAEIVGAEAGLEDARSDWDRVRPLGETGVVSDAEVVTVRTRFEMEQARLDALRQSLQAEEAMARRQEAEVTAATRNRELRVAEKLMLQEAEAGLARTEGELADARAALAEARLRVQRLEVLAPADGIIVERFKEPGSKIMLGMDDPHSAQVASLYDPAKLQVRVDVALADAAQVAIGQDCEVTVDVLPDQVFRGRVTRILHIADIQKNTLQAKVAVLDPRPELRPEMLARVKFLAAPDPGDGGGDGRARGALFVPAGAVRNGAVFIVDGFDGDRGVARLRPVETGRESDGWIEAVSGLNPGDLVVTSPPGDLRDGQRVRPQTPNADHGAMNHGLHRMS